MIFEMVNLFGKFIQHSSNLFNRCAGQNGPMVTLNCYNVYWAGNNLFEEEFKLIISSRKAFS